MGRVELHSLSAGSSSDGTAPRKLSAGEHDIPDSAAAIFARNEEFHELLGNLNIAVNEYNRIQEHLLDVEAPLIEQELAAIDAHLERGITQLNWNSVMSAAPAGLPYIRARAAPAGSRMSCAFGL